jgi:hypothetical protein
MTKMRFKKGHGIAMLMAAVLAFTACNNAVGTASGESGIALNAARAKVKLVDFRVPDVCPTLQDAFDKIEADSTETDFSITLTDDVSSGPIDVTAGGFAGKTITLTDEEEGYTVTLSSSGWLFTLSSGTAGSPVTLNVTGDVTLVGMAANNVALVQVNSGGILNLSGNAAVTGNTNTDNFGVGGGVAMSGGSLSLSGSSSITGNTARTGGGVYAVMSSTLVMGGSSSISNNTSTRGNGGGVVILRDSTMTMNGGTVSNNSATYNFGGGIDVEDDSTFTMNDGVISGNHVQTTTSTKMGGGGVSVLFGSVFNMLGGSIIGNDASVNAAHKNGAFGGGVYVSIHDSTFNMSGGVISGNTVYHESSIATPLLAGGGGVALDTGYYSNELTFKKVAAGVGVSIYGFSSPISTTSNNVVLGSPSSAPVTGYGSAIVALNSDTSNVPVTIVRHVESDVASALDISAVYGDSTGWSFSGNWPN